MAMTSPLMRSYMNPLTKIKIRSLDILKRVDLRSKINALLIFFSGRWLRRFAKAETSFRRLSHLPDADTIY